METTKKALLLVTWAGTIHYAKHRLQNDLNNYPRPVIVVINEIESVTDNDTLTWLMENYRTIPVEGNRWEVGGLQSMISFTDYDEWILIQDTLEIIDTSIFDYMFDAPSLQNKSVAYGPGWLCYLGKYRREILMQFPLPVCLTKADAYYHEHMLPRIYEQVASVIEGSPVHVMFPEWGNKNPKNHTDYAFGRENLVLYNDFVIKRKSLEWEGPLGTKASIEHR